MSRDITFSRAEDPANPESDMVDAYHINLTHNFARMANKACIFEVLWDYHGKYKTAGEMTELLEKGFQLLTSEPAQFKPLEAVNGWGTYLQFLSCVAEILQATREYPDHELFQMG